MQQCKIRGADDEWAKSVQGRINAVIDLHAADAVYHRQCSVNFRTLRDIPNVKSLLREPNKSSLADAIFKSVKELPVLNAEEAEEMYVLDGGSLLHSLHWNRKELFSDIAKRYTSYV